MTRRSLRALAMPALVVAGLALALGGPTARRRDLGDWPTYYFAARAALDGRDPWRPEVLRAVAAASDDPWRHWRERHPVAPFYYPPPFLLGTRWLGRLDPRPAWLAWNALQAVAVAAAAAAVRRGSRLPWPAVLALFAVFGPLWANWTWGQANVLLLPFLAAAVFAETPAGGAALATAALLKVSPGLAAGHWLAARRWRPLAGGLVAGAILLAASLLAVPADAWLRYWTDVLPALGGELPGTAIRLGHPMNHALTRFVGPLFGDPRLAELPPAAHRVLLALRLVAVGLLGAASAAWGSRRRPADRGGSLLLAAWVGAAVLLSTVAWEHHLVHFLLLAALLAAERRDGRLRGAAWALAVAAFALLAMPNRWLVAPALLFPEALFLCESGRALGGLVLVILAVRQALRPLRAGPPPGQDGPGAP